MKTIKGPAIFLAQFMGDEAPFNSLDSICQWVASLGYKGIQIPTWDGRCIDLEKAATSQTYCDEIKGIAAIHGLEITELSTHLQGQLVAVHPAYDVMFDGFAPAEVQGNPKARTFSGSLLWHTVYPWPQRPAGLVETGFKELGERWTPILNHYEDSGVDCCYEIHPGEDIHDGHTYEMFLEHTNNHARACILYDPSHYVLQQLDYLQFIDFYHERIRMFHVKDAEFNPTGKSGVYGGYQDWSKRAGRFRSLGDGQTDFSAIFSKLTQYGFDGWAVLEWECCIKSPEQGAAEGAPFIKNHIIEVTNKTFDDFAGGGASEETNRKILGL